MAIRPDYGLAMLEKHGMSEDGSIFFYDFAMPHISSVGPNLFSTQVGIDIDSVTHALSLDFSADLLGQILVLADSESAKAILNWREGGCTPSTLELDDPIHFAVECKFGSIEENERERYVPLIAQRLVSTEHDKPIEETAIPEPGQQSLVF